MGRVLFRLSLVSRSLGCYCKATSATGVGAMKHLCGSRCPCQRFEKLDLAHQYPVFSPNVIARARPELVQSHQELSQSSWIGSKIDEQEFCIGCLICGTVLSKADKDIWGRFEVKTVEALKPYRLLAHQGSEAHIVAFLRLLAGEDIGLPVKDSEDPFAPDTFQALIAYIRKGGSLRDGVPGVGHFKKVKCMTFALAEGNKRLFRQWLQRSATVNLLRDERHSRLLIRFRYLA